MTISLQPSIHEEESSEHGSLEQPETANTYDEAVAMTAADYRALRAATPAPPEPGLRDADRADIREAFVQIVSGNPAFVGMLDAAFGATPYRIAAPPEPDNEAVEYAAQLAHHHSWDSDQQGDHTTANWHDCAGWPCSVLRAATPAPSDGPAEPEPIVNETESGYARRRELVAAAAPAPSGPLREVRHKSFIPPASGPLREALDQSELIELLRRLDTEHSGPTMRWAAAVIRNLVEAPSAGPETPLDAAWRAVEAALPGGWIGPHLVNDAPAWTASASCRELPDGGGFEHESHYEEATGSTPAAALTNLAQRLADTGQDGGE